MGRPTVNAALADLAGAAGDLFVEATGDLSTRISGVEYDSRSVSQGDLFFCVTGARYDGHEFAAAAVEAGAAAICAERPTGVGVPELFVKDVRRAMPLISAAAFGYPAHDLLLVGVTGTNGKTTTVFLLDSILRAAGHATGLIGTIETRLGDEVRPGVRTTPESLDVQRLFAEMRKAVVVLPLVPVMPTTGSRAVGSPWKRAAATAIAERTSSTQTSGTPSPSGRATTSAAAPRSTAPGAKSWPSRVKPGTQKNTKPGSTARLS